MVNVFNYTLSILSFLIMSGKVFYVGWWLTFFFSKSYYVYNWKQIVWLLSDFCAENFQTFHTGKIRTIPINRTVKSQSLKSKPCYPGFLSRRAIWSLIEV